MLDLACIEAAINQIAAEKKLPREKLVEVIEAAIKTAYRKDFGSKDSVVNVHLDFVAGTMEISVEKTVAKEVEDPDLQIGFDELGEDADEYEEGDVIEIDMTDELMASEGFGRIASQAARQVIIQKIQESEKEKLYGIFKDKVGELANARVELVEKNRVVFDYNGTQVVLPRSEQSSKDRYTPGQRMFLYVKEVGIDELGGYRVILSRKDAELVAALFAMNVPELEDGTIEIANIVRNSGFKTKLIVASPNEEVDPAGCLIGPKGIRVRGVVDELFGEKVDIINYSDNKAQMIKESLVPGKIERVRIDEENETAYCEVYESEKAKVLGKGGVNVNLASELVGYRLVIEGIPDPETAETETAE
ncbi:MAG TPA: transcription termination factor NusA [bacterium]|nr:transcription termination factor NusA [bacterium]